MLAFCDTGWLLNLVFDDEWKEIMTVDVPILWIIFQILIDHEAKLWPLLYRRTLWIFPTRSAFSLGTLAVAVLPYFCKANLQILENRFRPKSQQNQAGKPVNKNKGGKVFCYPNLRCKMIPFPMISVPALRSALAFVSFLRTVRPENTSGWWRWEMCSEIFFLCVPSTLFSKKLTQALKRSHQKISCRRDFFAKNVMLVAVTLGCYIQKNLLYIKNRATKKKKEKQPFRKNGSKSSTFPNTFSYKHLPKITERNTLALHLHGAPCLIALQNSRINSSVG